jgi:hypothetical protein
VPLCLGGSACMVLLVVGVSPSPPSRASRTRSVPMRCRRHSDAALRRASSGQRRHRSPASANRLDLRSHPSAQRRADHAVRRERPVDGGVRPDARKNCQISPTAAPDARVNDNVSHHLREPVLPSTKESVKFRPVQGALWRISGKRGNERSVQGTWHARVRHTLVESVLRQGADHRRSRRGLVQSLSAR